VKKELDKKLCEDFPELYSQRHGDIRTAAMCWGFDCGDGWEPIIRKLSAQLALLPIQTTAIQVKEKFGTLRFYTSNWNKNNLPIEEFGHWCSIADACIEHACWISGQKCEECGEYGKVRTKGGSPYGWRKCVCKRHAAEFGYDDIRDDDSAAS
jgi:hypothetical protein